MTIGDEIHEMFAVLGACGKETHAIRTWVNMEQEQVGSGEELGPAATTPTVVDKSSSGGKRKEKP
jgi:hypothetical protein